MSGGKPLTSSCDAGAASVAGRRTIAVSAKAGCDAQARALAARLGLPVAEGADAIACDYVIEFTPRGLALRDVRDVRLKPLVVDLSLKPRGVSRRDLLPRAIGRKVLTVVDATAGLGRDALLLAGAGFRVTAIERCPVISALLADALRRAQGTCADAITVVEGDALEVLRVIGPVDAVYLDPMYPPSPKPSALAAKELRMLRDIVGTDPDACELLSAARRCARRRVVVKRPLRAPPLAAMPLGCHRGKLVRYDVYGPESS